MPAVSLELIERRIHVIRDQKVMIDSDLAELYGVATKNLNKAVRRNLARFPPDFMFQLSDHEVTNLRFQIGTSSFIHGGPRYLPLAFTEPGIAMLSSVLNSPRAIAMNIQIMRAFIRMREMLVSNDAMRKQLEELEHKVTSHDQAIVGIFKTLHELMSPQRTNAIGFIANVTSSAPE
ncbi:MAG: ORF6N domain-containing protein [Gammaproteobacteria bacterium]